MSRSIARKTGELLGAVAFALLSGCSGGGPAGPADVPGTTLGTVAGSTATFDGLRLEISSAWPGWGIAPVPGPRLDAVRIRMWNEARASRRFDPRALRIEASDGVQWERIVSGSPDELRPGTLGPLEDAAGWVIFRLPAESRPVALVWIAAPGLALRVPLPLPAKPR